MAPDDLNAALEDFSQSDLIFLDMSGCPQKDQKGMHEAQEIIKTINGLESYIVLSATTRDAELFDSVSRCSSLPLLGVMITKLDESTLYGSIYNLYQKCKLPFVFFAVGQQIPEDIEEASKERIVSLLMNL
jgi:flagellar biosynthesis protein FlhF